MCSLCTSPIPSTANELSTPLNLKSIFVAFVGSVFVNVLGKIANTPPPSFPPVIFSIASRWSGFALGSMYTRPVPFPMWIARGHRRPHANVVPSSLVVPNVPFRMCHDTSASQLPVVGSASKLHGHPHAQLQLWMYSVSIFHFVALLVVMMVAMMLPSALPMILAFRAMTKLDAGRPTKPADNAATALFILPYFLVWGGFGVAAIFGLMAIGLVGSTEAMTGPFV